MGRLATTIAAAGVDADNLAEKLPRVSLLDALLPSYRPKKKKDEENTLLPVTAGTTTSCNQKLHMLRSPIGASLLSSFLYSWLLVEHKPHQVGQHLHCHLALLAATNLRPNTFTMPFLRQPFFLKPFKLIAIDADTGKPLDPNVRRKITYEIRNDSHGSRSLAVHKSSSNAVKNDDKAKVDDKPADAKADEQKKDNGGGGQFKGPDVAWTPEEDAKLKAMKADGKTWKEISVEMLRGANMLKNRFKELAGKDQGQQDGADKGKGGGDQSQKGNNNQNNKQGGGQGKQDKKDKKNNNQNANKDDSKPKQDNNKKAPSKAPSKTNINNDTRFTMNDWLTVQEDGVFSFGELQCLSELLVKDSYQNWQRVAAKFFDLTGRRVHPDDVRDKFESMADMREGGK
ncbi:hypothetical protein Q7P37_001044 [Cladosporium fusiforme]